MLAKFQRIICLTLLLSTALPGQICLAATTDQAQPTRSSAVPGNHLKRRLAQLDQSGQPDQSQEFSPRQTPTAGPETQPGAIVVPAITFMDVNSGRFGKLEIDIADGEFMHGSCKNLHLTAADLDLNKGVLQSLNINITDGHVKDFIIDSLTLSSQGAMTFDTGIMFNHRIIEFKEPTEAQVTVEISQDSLNKFMNSPSTLDRLSLNASKKSGLIASLFGENAPSIGLSISNAKMKLEKSDRATLTFDSRVGMGQMAVPIPVEIQSKLALVDGWIQLQDTRLMTSGQELSPQISQFIVQKVNGLSNLGNRSDDIQFKFTDLKVRQGKGFVVTGTAQIKRLRFGS